MTAGERHGEIRSLSENFINLYFQTDQWRFKEGTNVILVFYLPTNYEAHFPIPTDNSIYTLTLLHLVLQLNPSGSLHLIPHLSLIYSVQSHLTARHLAFSHPVCFICK